MTSIIVNVKRALSKALNFLLIVAISLLVLDVVWGVFTRYVLGAQANWTEELARFLLMWVALLGGAVAFGTKGHLGVDYFVDKFHPEVRKQMAIVSHVLVLFFAAVIFVYGGGMVVYDSLAVEQVTPALGWKIGYVYMALPISGIFMILFTIDNLLETLSETVKADDGEGEVNDG